MKILRFSKFCYTKSINIPCGKAGISSGSFRNVSDSLIPGEPRKQISPHIMKEKFNDLVKWYEELTGMDEVRMMQNRVIEAQDKFVATQEKRRGASQALASVQNKLKDIYAELDTTSRGEERYLQLITQEHSILKDEKKLQADFSLLEREERETFTLLSNCVKESHEKERAQAERTKYWSVIGSVVGTIIGILGSSINNEFKMRELRKLVKESVLKSEGSSPNELLKHQQELSSILLDMKTIIHKTAETKDTEYDRGVIGRLDQLLHTVSKKHDEETTFYISESVQRLNQNLQDLKNILHSAQRHDGHLIAIPADIESMIQAQRHETRVVLVSATVIGVLIPIFVTYLQKWV